MGWSFRRSLNLGGGFRLNLSSRGIGLSGGVRGFRAGFGPRGKRVQVSVPGTGISYRKEEAWAAPAAGDEGTAPSSPAGALRFVILGIVLTIIAIVLFAALTR
jgi:hypothetical protein